MLCARDPKMLAVSLLFCGAAVALTSPRGTSSEVAAPNDQSVTVENLRVEYMSSPVGLDKPHPRFSWVGKVSSSSLLRDVNQTAYCVRIWAADRTVWSSGRVESDTSTFIRLDKDIELLSATRYTWSVSVWTTASGVAVQSENASFITGLLNRNEWGNAEWIRGWGKPANGTEPAHPGLANVFRREFHLPAKLDIASSKPPLAFVSGVGYFELFCNGKKLTDRMLDPGYTNFVNRVYYVTFDLSDCLLWNSSNVLGVMTGNGWWSKPYHIPEPAGSDASKQSPRYPAPTPPQLILQTVNMRVPCYTAAEEEAAGTWQAAVGPVIYDSIWDGETYDARRELLDTSGTAWSQPGYDAASADWRPALPASAIPTTARLTSSFSPPIRFSTKHAPVSVQQPRPGVYVFDFGVNMAGLVKLRIPRSRDLRCTRIQLRHAEILVHPPYCGAETNDTVPCDGMIYNRNLRSARATDVYIMRGGPNGEIYMPRFTQHGFRYVEITGLDGIHAPKLADVTAHEMSSDISISGGITFEGEPLLDKIQGNILRSATSNLMSVPTDCPSRDERYGWMGDAMLASEVNMYALNVNDLGAFYSAWLELVQDDQDAAGFVHDLTPAVSTGPAVHTPVSTGPGAGAWQSAYPSLVWAMYRYVGDIGIIQQHWNSLKTYVKWFDAMYANSTTAHFLADTAIGDWCPPPQGSCPPATWCPEPGKYQGGFTCQTPYSNKSLTAVGSYMHDIRLMIELAEAVDDQTTATEYTRKIMDLRADFNRTFFSNESSNFGRGWQTEQGYPLWLDAVAPEAIAPVLNYLESNIIDNKKHTNSGILGMKVVLEALTKLGRTHIGLQMLLQTTYPSIGWQIEGSHGEPATTLWELWDAWTEDASMDSRNHIMFGSPLQWFYKALAGINTVDGVAGYHSVVIEPPSPTSILNVSNLTGVNASVSTTRGELSSQWSADRSTCAFTMQAVVPLGMTAILALPVFHVEGTAGRPKCSVVEGSTEIYTSSGHFVAGAVSGVRAGDFFNNSRGAAFRFEVGSGSYRLKLQCLPCGQYRKAAVEKKPTVLPETDWFSHAARGVFTHYLSNLQNDYGRNSQGKNSTWDECVDEFDVEAYARDAAATGARYAVITMMQQSRYMIAPNRAYGEFTGYQPGDACSRRDLVLDLHEALAKQNLKMLLYWTCDGPSGNEHAHTAVGWPQNHDAECPFTSCAVGNCTCSVPSMFLERWSAVLEEYALRYGTKIAGWWLDGCFRRPYQYNESSLRPFHDAVRAGNPRALVAFNNGVHHPIGTFPDRISKWEDYTTGESDDFTETPTSRFVTGPPSDPAAPNVTAQWHTLTYLGSQWGAPGLCQCCRLEACCRDTCTGCDPLNSSYIRDYSSKINSVGGVLTVDLQLLRNGSMNAAQLQTLKRAWQDLP